MAQKELVNGTVREIDGGKCMVGGTVREIDYGTVLVGGTVRKISFSTQATVEVTGTMGYSDSVTIKGPSDQKITQTNQPYIVPSGTIIEVYISASNPYEYVGIDVNNQDIASYTRYASATVRANSGYVEIHFDGSNGSNMRYARITGDIDVVS